MNAKQRDALIEYANTPGRTEPVLMIVDNDEPLSEECFQEPKDWWQVIQTDSFYAFILMPDGSMLQEGKIILRDKEVDVKVLLEQYARLRKIQREVVIENLGDVERNRLQEASRNMFHQLKRFRETNQ